MELQLFIRRKFDPKISLYIPYDRLVKQKGLNRIYCQRHGCEFQIVAFQEVQIGLPRSMIFNYRRKQSFWILCNDFNMLAITSLILFDIFASYLFIFFAIRH